MIRELALAVDNLLIGHILILSLKRRMARGQLIHKDAECPDINPFIVLVAFDDFRRDVVDGAAEGLAFAAQGKWYQVGAQVDQPKSLILSTPCCSMMFYGLMSRWMMLSLCMYLRAAMTCLPQQAVSSSVSLTLARKSRNRHCEQYSKMRQMFLESSNTPYSLRMLGWFMQICSLISQNTCSTISASLILDLLMTLSAQSPRVAFSSARQTLPKRPLPSLAPNLKLPMLSWLLQWALRFLAPIFSSSFSLFQSIFRWIVVWLADLGMIWGNYEEEPDDSSLRFREELSFLRALECSFWELWWDCSVWQREMWALDAVLVKLMSCTGVFLDLLNIFGLFSDWNRETMCLVDWQALSCGRSAKLRTLRSFSSLVESFLKKRALWSFYWLGCLDLVERGLYIQRIQYQPIISHININPQ